MRGSSAAVEKQPQARTKISYPGISQGGAACFGRIGGSSYSWRQPRKALPQQLRRGLPVQGNWQKIRLDHLDHKPKDKKNLLFYRCRVIMQKNQISGYSGAGTAPHLGCGDRAFESHYSDQLMIIRTLSSKWGTGSDLSFLSRISCRPK